MWNVLALRKFTQLIFAGAVMQSEAEKWGRCPATQSA